MNVALVIFSADPARGGAERYTGNLASALAQRGHRVDLIAARLGPPIDGVRMLEIPSRAATRSGEYRKFLTGLDRHLETHSYDIVHAMLPVPRCDVYHPHAGMAKSAFEATPLNRLNRKRKLYAQVEEKLLTGPRRPTVLCLSNFVKGFILTSYPDIAGQLETLFNAVDLNHFDPSRHGCEARKPFNLGTDKIVGLMIAQHFLRKGLAQAIVALAKLDERMVLWVIGNDNPAPAVKLAKRLGIADRVIFAGTTKNPADFYAAADYFVLPTPYDSCSLVVLEALAMGLPVISTARNGACEIMTDGKEGFVLQDPDDVPGLTSAMRHMQDADRRADMKKAALALRPRLSYEAHLDRLEEIYRASHRAH
ncbi:MAG: glycosyltransferase family 4 protein [Tepidisphaeraceae bacterium]